VFAGYQTDVSLAPPDVDRIAKKTAKDPSAPQPGVYRLVDAPQMKHLPSGWYSVLAQAFLYGGKCGKSGCTGQIRQNRFKIR